MQSTISPIFPEGIQAERSQIPAQSHLASCTEDGGLTLDLLGLCYTWGCGSSDTLVPEVNTGQF